MRNTFDITMLFASFCLNYYKTKSSILNTHLIYVNIETIETTFSVYTLNGSQYMLKHYFDAFQKNEIKSRLLKIFSFIRIRVQDNANIKEN